MDTVLLFRKRSLLTDDRLPWLRGATSEGTPGRIKKSAIMRIFEERGGRAAHCQVRGFEYTPCAAFP